MCESSYCFQRVLAIAILSICLSVTWVDKSKMVHNAITKSSSSAAWKTIVLGFFINSKEITPNEGAK